MSLSRQNSQPRPENFDRVKEWWQHLNHPQNRLRCINFSSQIIPKNRIPKMFRSILSEPADGSLTNWVRLVTHLNTYFVVKNTQHQIISNSLLIRNKTTRIFDYQHSNTKQVRWGKLELWIVRLSNWRGEKNFRVTCEMLSCLLLRRKRVPVGGWWNDDVMTSLNRMLSG